MYYILHIKVTMTTDEHYNFTLTINSCKTFAFKCATSLKLQKCSSKPVLLTFVILSLLNVCTVYNLSIKLYYFFAQEFRIDKKFNFLRAKRVVCTKGPLRHKA